jgi:hypothetical protein
MLAAIIQSRTESALRGPQEGFASVLGSATSGVVRWLGIGMSRKRNCPHWQAGEAMRPSSIYNRWTQFIETLRKKWVGFGDGIVRALAEEEMKIRRAELQNQIMAHNQRD